MHFREFELGELRLPAGRSTVKLRATAKPRFAVMDLDRFVLTRTETHPR